MNHSNGRKWSSWYPQQSSYFWYFNCWGTLTKEGSRANERLDVSASRQCGSFDFPIPWLVFFYPFLSFGLFLFLFSLVISSFATWFSMQNEETIGTINNSNNSNIYAGNWIEETKSDLTTDIVLLNGGSFHWPEKKSKKKKKGKKVAKQSKPRTNWPESNKITEITRSKWGIVILNLIHQPSTRINNKPLNSLSNSI